MLTTKLPPLHELIDPVAAIKALRPMWKSCPGCGAELSLTVQNNLLLRSRVRCSACGCLFSWESGVWLHRQVSPRQVAAFLTASKLTDDKEALARAAGVSVASVRLWLRDQ